MIAGTNCTPIFLLNVRKFRLNGILQHIPLQVMRYEATKYEWMWNGWTTSNAHDLEYLAKRAVVLHDSFGFARALRRVLYFGMFPLCEILSSEHFIFNASLA